MEPSPKQNIYRPKVSDISEDDQSDLEKLNSPKLVDQMKQAQVCIPKLMRSPTAGSKTKSPVLPKTKSPVPKSKSPVLTKTKSPAVPKSKSPVPTKPKGQVPKPKSPVPNLPNMKCSVRVRKLPSPKGKVMLGSSIDEPIDTNVNPSKK